MCVFKKTVFRKSDVAVHIHSMFFNDLECFEVSFSMFSFVFECFQLIMNVFIVFERFLNVFACFMSNFMQRFEMTDFL